MSHSSISNQGFRRYYRCNLVRQQGTQCNARLLVVESSFKTTFEVFSSSSGHTHDIIANKFQEELRNDILSLSRGGMLPKHIEQYINRKHKDSQERMPTLKQIQNIVNYHNRTHENQPVISVGDVVTWIQKHDESSGDFNDDEPFVIGYKHSEPVDNERYFQYVISTKQLLKNASGYRNMCADATYKVVYQGYPLLLAGSVDANRKFHLIAAALSVSERAIDYEFFFNVIQKSVERFCSSEFKPTVLISDASTAIINAFYKTFESATSNVVCWAHVKRNVYKKTSNSEILSDIDKLQLMPDKKTFERGSKLFLQKWKSSNEKFCSYFQKTWLLKNCNWYEGCEIRIPSTNNALESNNSQIKKKYTLRKRLDISRFNVQLFNFVRDMAQSYSNENVYELTPVVSKDDWQAAILFAKNEKQYHIFGSLDGARQTIYVPSSEYLAKQTARLTRNDIEKLNKKKMKDFDNHILNVFAVWKIEIDSNNFQISTSLCSCPVFMKKYVCKHILGVALRLHLAKAPADANPSKLNDKKKRGRPKLAKKALIVQ